MSETFTLTDRAFVDGLSGNREAAKKYLLSKALWQSFCTGLQKYYIRMYELNGGHRN